MDAMRENVRWRLGWLTWNLLLVIGVGIAITWLGFVVRNFRSDVDGDAVDFLSSTVDFFLLIALAPACIAVWASGSGLATALWVAGLRNTVALRGLLIVILAAAAWYAAGLLDFGPFYYISIAIGFGTVALLPRAVPWTLEWLLWNVLLSTIATVTVSVLWLAVLALFAHGALVADVLILTSYLWIGVWIVGCGLIALLWRLGVRHRLVLRTVLVTGPLLFFLAGTDSRWLAGFLVAVQCGFGLVARLPAYSSDNADELLPAIHPERMIESA